MIVRAAPIFRGTLLGIVTAAALTAGAARADVYVMLVINGYSETFKECEFGLGFNAVAQVVGHPVVDVDQGVQLRLARLTQAGREVVGANEVDRRANQVDGPEQGADQPQAEREGENEEGLDGKQPGFVFPEQRHRCRREDDVDEDQVQSELRAQAHKLIPYFSMRR